MSKTITSNMRSHLAQDVTTITTAWIITRTDNEVFRFTTNAADITIDIDDGNGPQIFSAAEGYSRSNIQKDADMSVSNMEVVGVFDMLQLKEEELRRGLFDYADVRIFFFNYNDPSPTMGIVKEFRGEFGEAIMTPRGYFTIELRDLTQVLHRELGEHYSKDCRADLGDRRCRIPLHPDVVERNTAYALGRYVRVSNDTAFQPPTLVVPADTNANDIGPLLAIGTLGSLAVVQSVEDVFGNGAFEFSPDGSDNPSNSFVSFPDLAAYTIGTNPFTIECWVRFKDLTETIQVIASQYLNTGDQRAWFLRRNAGDLEFQASANGSTMTFTLTGAFAFVIDTWYHVAVTRDFSNNVTLFVDGNVVGSPSVSTINIFNSNSVFYLGKLRSAGADDQPLDGFIDDFRFLNGVAAYTGTFTPPIAAHSGTVVDPDTLFNPDFDELVYRCTVAGTTALIQPMYDADEGETTVDGTASFIAEFAWTRSFEVVEVLEERRRFKVTELTPNTGGPRGGFPDDWFNLGAVIFETGDNAGRVVEVRDFIADDGITIEQEIELFDDVPFTIEVGDTGRIQPGCDKLFATCIAKFNNAINFVGEPFGPNQDVMGQYPDAHS